MENKHSWSSVMLSFLLVFSSLSILVGEAGIASATLPGSGTEDDPYQIGTVEQLQEMNNDLSAHYILVNDIDASETSTWNGGQGFLSIGVFTGSFNGNGYVIKNLFINSRMARYNYTGLFWKTSSEAVIKNVGLENVTIIGRHIIGSMVGLNKGSIINSYSTGSVAGRGQYTGGLVGYNYGSISNSYFTGSVTNSNFGTGGLVGYNHENISNSYSTGSVVNRDFEVGGLVGSNEGGRISNSYSTASVWGYGEVGGLVGYNYGSISNSYSTGSVGGYDNLGGLVGCWYENVSNSWCENVSNSFWDIETSGMTRSAGGTGKTTVEMKQQATFVGWDFTNIWNLIEGETYPYLRWQIQVIPATIDIDPDTLNPKSKGKWITAYIELPKGYDVEGIDVGSITLNGLSTEWVDIQDSVLMVKFDRQAVQAIVSVGDDVELTVTGEVDGIPFEGSDTIRVIRSGKTEDWVPPGQAKK